MGKESTTVVGCEIERFQECKNSIEALTIATQLQAKEQGIYNAALEDRLKDLNWAMKTAERLLVLVNQSYSS